MTFQADTDTVKSPGGSREHGALRKRRLVVMAAVLERPLGFGSVVYPPTTPYSWPKP